MTAIAPAWRRRAGLVAVPLAAWLPSAAAGAQARPPLVNAREALAAAALVASSALLDREIRDGVAASHHPALADLTSAGNALGAGRYLIAGMAATYGGARLSGSHRWSDATLHVAAAYVAGNVVVSVLKPVVGRERPYVAGEPARFHPFSRSGDDHSFPSGHAIHAFSIAAAVSEEARRPWVTGAAYTTAAVVGLARVYDDQHWTSDVVAGGALGALAAKATVRWLHARGDGEGSTRARARVLLLPDGLVVSAPLPW